MKRSAIIIAAVLLLAGCKTVEPIESKGSYTIDGVTYSFTSLRVDHVGYVSGSDSTRFILRLTGFPGTFKMDTVSHKGYGTVIQLFVIADRCELYPGDETVEVSKDFVSHVVTIEENGDTSKFIPVTGATVRVSGADNNFYRYDLTLTDANGQTTGEYTGKHVVNRLVDQPVCGRLVFDTIDTRLASAVMYDWGHLFSADFNYQEIIFYSTNSRFNDDGKLRQGVQFSVGFMSSGENRPPDGNYSVSVTLASGNVMYGHKVQDVNWGTYWTVYYSSSSVGKANVLSGDLKDLVMTDKKASFSFDFKDQLNNDVTGYFEGGVIRVKNY